MCGHAVVSTVSSVAACCIQHTPYYALSVGMTQQFFVFLSRWPWPLTFDLWPLNSNSGEIFVQCTKLLSFVNVCLIIRKLSCGQTNWQTDKLTNKQTPLKTSTSLRWTMPVGNDDDWWLEWRVLWDKMLWCTRCVVERRCVLGVHWSVLKCVLCFRVGI